MDRRTLLKTLAAAGTGAAVFARALHALAAEPAAVSPEKVRQAAWVAGLELTDGEIQLMLEDLGELLESFEKIRAVALDNAVPPALHFRPAANPPAPEMAPRPAEPTEWAASARPGEDTDLAFLPVRELAALVRARQVSSTELTQLYLDRLEALDPMLHFVITLTRERALRQAARADREIVSGRYRGPLHGIPWGAKDLLSVPGYPTTWGAAPYKDQVREETATVVRRLDEAGAVLVAKLTLGALAWGDVWFGGKTRNPWNPEQGSSGSSAGSASATAAGAVGFALGSETWGSIVSPSTRCGATGLRPTFGRVSRYGAMALAWSMDKLGPIARSVEDCALVFSAIHGADGLDPTAVTAPFAWPPRRDVRSLEVGYPKELFEQENWKDVEDEEFREFLKESHVFDLRTLETLESMGVRLVPMELPSDLPVEALSFILTAEAAAAFDELTRSGRDDLLVRQEKNAWPNVFRQGQLIPAVEYIRANRIRTRVMQAMEEALGKLDAYVTPAFGGNHLLLTNLTGHPAVVLPNGFREKTGTPTSITFMGRLYGDDTVLALAHAYQEATDFHLRRPPVAAGQAGP